MPASLKIGERDSRKSGTSSAPSSALPVDLAVYGGQNGPKVPSRRPVRLRNAGASETFRTVSEGVFSETLPY
jgi:hypothetical protein